MSLEDLVKIEIKPRRGKQIAGEKQAAGGDGEGAARGHAGRRIMKLRSTPPGKAKAKAKAKGTAKAKAQNRRRAVQESWGSGGRDMSWLYYGGQQESWRRGNDFVTWESRKRPSGSGMYSDWNSGGKRRASDDWGPPQKWTRSMDGPRSGMGWGPSDEYSGWGSGGRDPWGGDSALAISGGGQSRPSERWAGRDVSWGNSGACDRTAGRASGWARTLARAWGSSLDRDAPRGGGAVRRASVDLPAPPRVGERACRIRVSNVPRNLDWRDIKEAFEDNGRVTQCEVERGVAWITFSRPSDAKKAVQTFDRGELNGQTIFVTHE
mmetsp:Transcript_83146/g.248083  ORF Transcript_83146/g.248083 Transcript_83146/m.248083 type:complete len:322 (+) Transcript_83146:1-966(+)